MRSSSRLVERAAAVARAAVETVPEVEAAMVFGSVARASADASSDVDVLLVTSQPIRASELATSLRPRSDLGAVATSVNSWHRLAELRAKGSLFFRHLQLEGEILEDPSGRLADLLAPPVVNVDVAAHRAALARSVALYSDLTRLGDFYLFALAHLYVLAKRAAQLCLQEVSRDIYDPDRVFAEVTFLHPELSAQIDRVRRLRPLHAVVRGTHPQPQAVDVPYDPAVVEEARATVEHLLHR